jgi:hypothetical protein
MSVAQKLNQVMRQVSVLTCDSKMQGQGNYPYLSEDKLVSELHKAFTEVGLVILPTNVELLDNREIPTSNNGTMYISRVLMTFTLIDIDTPKSVIVLQAIGEAGDTGDKVIKKCQTAAYKQALMQACMITTGEDPDAASQPRKSTNTIPVVKIDEIKKLAARKFGSNTEKFREIKSKIVGRDGVRTEDLRPGDASKLIAEMNKLPDVE